jgi:hypothetical protein
VAHAGGADASEHLNRGNLAQPLPGHGARHELRSSASSAAASPTVPWTPAATSITAACVSSVTRLRSSAGSRPCTSSDRNASVQPSGSSSMNSSSTPIVSWRADGHARHAAQAGTFVMTAAPRGRDAGGTWAPLEGGLGGSAIVRCTAAAPEPDHR